MFGSIRDLLPTLWLKENVLVLHGYFDDSGDNGSTVEAVGGFVASVDAWATYFEPAWGQFLRRHDLPYFRMSQYENRKGPYRDWSNEQRIREIQELLQIITRTAQVGIGVAMDMQAYRRFQPKLLAVFGETLHPYHLCAHWGVTMLGKWNHENNATHELALFFEQGSDGTGSLLSTLRHLGSRFPFGFRNESPFIVAGKDRYMPLQAADIMAYETFKSARRLLGHDSRSHRKSLITLLQAEGIEYLQAILDDEYFEHLLSYTQSSWKAEGGET